MTEENTEEKEEDFRAPESVGSEVDIAAKRTSNTQLVSRVALGTQSFQDNGTQCGLD